MLVKNWTIRKANLKDLNYFHESIQQIHSMNIDMDIFKEQFVKKLRNRNCLLYVIETTLANPIGCICCEKEESLLTNKPIIQIKEFYISPMYRKLNIADELFLYIYEKSVKLGMNKIEVLCNLNSTTTQNFYARKKFLPIKKLYVKTI
jgi:N-acetylglutamate synthase-like GNAT family acetyltransferase